MSANRALAGAVTRKRTPDRITVAVTFYMPRLNHENAAIVRHSSVPCCSLDAMLHETQDSKHWVPNAPDRRAQGICESAQRPHRIAADRVPSLVHRSP